jgi:hypothetical protein
MRLPDPAVKRFKGTHHSASSWRPKEGSRLYLSRLQQQSREFVGRGACCRAELVLRGSERYLREYLDLVLRQQAIIINREVEIRNLSGRGIGERTDLLISAASKNPESSKLDVAEVVVECKGCWDDGLFDEMESQLRDRYLRGAGYKYGIHLVGWFLCPLWSHDDPRYRQAAKLFGQMSLSDVRTQFAVQAAALSGDVKISSCVLDLSLG